MTVSTISTNRGCGGHSDGLPDERAPQRLREQKAVELDA
jgi:hypothetical protein